MCLPMTESVPADGGVGSGDEELLPLGGEGVGGGAETQEGPKMKVDNCKTILSSAPCQVLWATPHPPSERFSTFLRSALDRSLGLLGRGVTSLTASHGWAVAGSIWASPLTGFRAV